MPDGPFRNQPISSRAKTFANATCSEAESLERCTGLAGHAILGMLFKENRSLLAALRAWASCSQLGLDATVVVDRLLAEHPISQFSNTLQRELQYCLNQSQTNLEAYERGLRAACMEFKQAFKIRIEEEGLEVLRKGELSKESHATFVLKCGEAVSRLDDERLFRAVRDGLEREFATDAKKKDGVDDGPS